jgi:hypothetical protein
VGLLAKSTTKKRVQPAAGSLNPALTRLQDPWRTNAGILVAALLRAMVCSVDLTGARSSSVRGRTSVLGPSFATNSVFWVRAIDATHWRFTLGVTEVRGGIAADWTIDLTIAGDQVNVATGRYLTRDDHLVHGDEHDALRTELLRALSLGSAPAEAEIDISATSIRMPINSSRSATDTSSVDFSIVTSLDATVSERRLGKLGFRRIDENSTRWAIGLPSNDETDYVTLTHGGGRLDFRGAIGSKSPAGRRFGEQGLRAFIDRALFLIRREDESAQYQGSSSWAPV